MAKISYNKSYLQKQNEQLKLYRKLLPSLDLKRRQLTFERVREQKMHEALSTQKKKLAETIGVQLPMLARTQIDLRDLVKITTLKIEEENIVGIRLPVLREVVCEIVDYSMFVKPQWVDFFVEKVRDMLTLCFKVKIAGQRVELLRKGVKHITQRVNLFEKILIPEAKETIFRIKIFLDDAERSAVVRAKIAKQKHLKENLQRVEEPV
ncbi:MAG: V-type ATP synthase subunit D [Candidatus Ancaeobacter aquaticus]|nr:V-type ATP synthase subunit D [Candidatus Ancaeobacter aquaticus]